MIRPAARQHLQRWWDLYAGLALMGLGARMAWAPGYVVPAAGVAVAGLGAAFAITSAKRRRPPWIPARGYVEIIEGQLAYYTAEGGWFIPLDDLVELACDGTDWTLTGADGRTLRVPCQARGVEALTDALLRLPGLDPDALLRRAGKGGVAVWRRPGTDAPGAVPLTWARPQDRSGPQ